MDAKIIELNQDTEKQCSFCRKKYDAKVTKMFDGQQGKCICEHCVTKAMALIQDEE